jgi:Cd2+/Zn2+-exporting ATPase
MVTGDRKEVAEPLADSLNLDEVRWELLPEDKLLVVTREREDGHTVMVVGDGVNDALALAAGDVGVAMGAAGCQIAIESSDVALMHNDLRALPAAVELSRYTRRTVNWNVVIGGGYSIFMLSLAVSGLVSPVAAAALHNLGSVFVLGNSARLLGHSSRHTT